MNAIFSKLIFLSAITAVCFSLASCSSPEPDPGTTIADAVTYTKKDDQGIAKASAEAKAKWGIFKKQFDAKYKHKNVSESVARREVEAENNDAFFQVKAPVSGEGRTEHFWIEVDSIEGNTIKGRYGCDGVDVLTIHKNDPATVAIEKVEDWMIIDGETRQGGFSVFVLMRKVLALANKIDENTADGGVTGFDKLQAHWNKLDPTLNKKNKTKSDIDKQLTFADKETMAAVILSQKLYLGNNGHAASDEELSRACNLPVGLVKSMRNVLNAPD